MWGGFVRATSQGRNATLAMGFLSDELETSMQPINILAYALIHI